MLSGSNTWASAVKKLADFASLYRLATVQPLDSTFSSVRNKLTRLLASFGLAPLERLANDDDLPEELAAYLFSEADYDHPFTWDTDPDDAEDEEDVPTE